MKKYVFKPYLKNFPELFQKERGRIVSGLNVPVVIEHIGSTAVPGLGGKGIIDIGIATDKNDMELVSQKLQAIGYEFRSNFSTEDRFYFITYLPDPEEGTRRYHIHLTYPENPEWQEFLDFRDYLIAYPEALQEYAQLKQHAVSEAKDEGEKYRKIKDPLFKKIRSKIHAINNPVNQECQENTHIRVMEKNDIEVLANDFCFLWSSIQELYFQLGYSPDGCGVTYKYQPTIPGESYSLDDELILWLKKDL